MDFKKQIRHGVSGRVGKIVWIASYPKSGSTWVRAFLTSYIKGGVNISINEIMPHSDTGFYYYHVVSPADMHRIEPTRIVLLKPAMLLHMLEANRQQDLFVKTHDANIAVIGQPLIPLALTAGAIHIVRDPREVLVSLAKYTNISHEAALKRMKLKEASLIFAEGNNIHTITSSWDFHTESWLGNNSFPMLLVRYEDLIDNPLNEFKKILQFAKLPVEYGRLKKSIKACDFKRMQKQEEQDGFLESDSKNKFFNFGLKDGWKNILEKEIVYDIELSFQPLMKKLGYL